jgi:excisionase family DNA binding protein
VLDDPDYVTTSPAAHILGCSEVTVRAMADRGDLPCVRTSTGARLFRRADVEWVARELARTSPRRVPVPCLDPTQSETAVHQVSDWRAYERPGPDRCSDEEG